MVSKRVFVGFLLLALLGLGVTAYLAKTNGHATVFAEEVEISPSTYTIKMNASSIYTRNVTVSTNDGNEITVTLRVLPGNYATAKAWGEDFYAFASPSEVKISKGHPAKITIVHYAGSVGDYEVKIVAVR